jgi:transcription initiation factor TFIIIB Brf1 subunit/transcription initiation factor TFIIB
MHWWTFLGYFNEIGEGLLSTVISIRQKKNKGKNLEKYEQEFYRANKSLIDIKARLTPEEQAEKEYFEKILNG